MLNPAAIRLAPAESESTCELVSASFRRNSPPHHNGDYRGLAVERVKDETTWLGVLSARPRPEAASGPIPLSVNLDAGYPVGYFPCRALAADCLVINCSERHLEVFLPRSGHLLQLGPFRCPPIEFRDWCSETLKGHTGRVNAIILKAGGEDHTARLLQLLDSTGLRPELTVYHVELS